MNRPAEFDRLLEAHHRENCSTLSKMVGEDAAQDTYERAMKYWYHYKEGTNFDGWISTIARSREIQRELDKTRDAEVMEEYAHRITQEKGDQQEVDKYLVEAAIIIERMDDERLANIAKAYLLFGYSQEEIGEGLGISQQRADVLVRKALMAIMETDVNEGSNSRHGE